MSLFKILSHVSITVTDVTKARDFYTGVLGFQEIPRPAFDFPRIWYSLGGDLQLHIILNDQLVRPATEREKIVARYPHFALWTEDVDGTARRTHAIKRRYVHRPQPIDVCHRRLLNPPPGDASTRPTMPDQSGTVATRLVEYRDGHNLTQTALAEQLEMKQPAIARLKSGEHNPSLDTLLRIAITPHGIAI